MDSMTEWEGGPQPVAHDVIVHYRLRKGVEGYRRAELLDWHWRKEDAGQDIVAYEVVETEIPRNEQ